MGTKLGAKSLKNLEGIHPDLRKIINYLVTMPEFNKDFDVTVLEGLRTIRRQKVLLKAGATTTMDSRHIQGMAVDLGVLINGKLRWDWPLYAKLAVLVKRAAKVLDIPIEWGGDWKRFKDGPHFQLPKKQYPNVK